MGFNVDISTEAPDAKKETPLTRLRDLFSYAFTKVDYDDPNLPETPVELRDFGSSTVFVMGAGLVIGCGQQWWRERSAPAPKIPSGFSKAERAKFLGELKTRQLIRVLNSTLRGGMWCGWLAALYFGVQGLSVYARQVRDPWNTVLGAWACGSVAGFALGGPGWMSRLQSASGAVFLAGLMGYPMGYLQLKLDDMIRPEQKNAFTEMPSSVNSDNLELEKTKVEKRRTPYPVREYDVVGAVIGKLDQSLQETEKFK